MLEPFTRRPDNGLGLISKVGGEFSVCGHHLGWRMDFFAVAGRVRGDLRGLLSRAACAFEVIMNLLAAGTRCVQVVLRVALDLRCSAAPRRDFVTEMAQSVGQFGLVDGSGELLRGEEAVRLNSARLAALSLGDVKNYRVSVQLRRNVTVDRTCGIVLERRSNEFARGFGRIIAADASLCVALELVKGNADTLPVGFADTLIAAD